MAEDQTADPVLSPEMITLLAKLSGVTSRLEKAVARLEGSVDDPEERSSAN